MENNANIKALVVNYRENKYECCDITMRREIMMYQGKKHYGGIIITKTLISTFPVLDNVIYDIIILLCNVYEEKEKVEEFFSGITKKAPYIKKYIITQTTNDVNKKYEEFLELYKKQQIEGTFHINIKPTITDVGYDFYSNIFGDYILKNYPQNRERSIYSKCA